MIDEKLKNCQILLVDDEESELEAYSLLLTSIGVRRVRTLTDSRQVMAEIETLQSPVVFLDLNMPHISGQQILRQLKAEKPHIPVIIITANSEIETAVECLKLGAHDYLVKPIELKMFTSSLRNALEIGMLRNEVMSLKGINFGSSQQRHQAFAGILTQNPAMLAIFNYMESIAASFMPVLILGETGSGKELVAKAIHDISGLPGDYVTVDVSGLDDTLFSDTLFGHTKGAYTGADASRSGLLGKAGNGTIFLDEIGDLSEVSQVKLLRVLQERSYYPLGSDSPRQCDARFIAAANKDLTQLAGQPGEFRMDLYYRLSTHLIRIPPLRERREDIPLLVDHLIAAAAESLQMPKPAISRQAMKLLLCHPFYGNVRELKAYLGDAVARSAGGVIGEEVIRERLSPAAKVMGSAAITAESQSLVSLFGHFPTLDELAEYAIDQALASSDSNQSQAAQMLGISRQALNKRLRKNNVNQS
ncbi:MAG: sigma-54-dependent transcriptional regulator [Desulfopila sp.]